MRVQELEELCQKYPVSIPVAEAAKFLGMSAECLRAACDQGKCPFGFSWRLGERAGYKISSDAFYCWITGAPQLRM